MQLPYRNGIQPGSESVRFGFNGMEKDDELKGSGNSYDFGARMYDPRIGRWLSRDALEAKYPSFSPYNFVNNMPIVAVDPDGKKVIIPLTVRLFRPKLARTYKEIIQTEAFRNTFQDYMSAKNQKKYYCDKTATDGKYSDKVKIKLKHGNLTKNTGFGEGLTDYTISSNGKKIETTEYGNLTDEEITNATFSSVVKIDLNSHNDDQGNLPEGALAESSTHEITAHLEQYVRFFKEAILEKESSPEILYEKGFSVEDRSNERLDCQKNC